MMESRLPNFDTMTVAEFEQFLPELFAGGEGRISSDPRFATFFEKNPDCAALVRDLETIAEHARSLIEPKYDPSDNVWSKIQDRLKEEETEENKHPIS